MKDNPADIIGQKFGELTAIEFLGYKKRGNSNRNGAKYLFQCDCGTKKEVFLNAVRSGNTKTCGNNIHYKKNKITKDLTGFEFGRLKVKEFLRFDSRVYKNVDRTYEIWLCECSCGNNTELKSTLINNKRVLSCGCLLKEKRGSNPYKLDYGTASLNAYFQDYVYRAKIKNIPFELDLEKFKEIIYSNCYYCGCKPSCIYPKKRKKFNGCITKNGIDRKDSSQGYVIENCVACCKQCNRGKLDYSYQEFLDWVKRVYEKQYKSCG